MTAMNQIERKPFKNLRLRTEIWQELTSFAFHGNQNLVLVLEAAILDYLEDHGHTFLDDSIEPRYVGAAA